MIEPRIIRLKDAPGYLGMDKNKFNELVRPFVTEIRYGSMSVGFDRVDLDRWLDEYKAHSNGRRGQKGGYKPWRERSYQGSSSAERSGTSTKLSEDAAFARALEKATSKRPSNS